METTLLKTNKRARRNCFVKKYNKSDCIPGAIAYECECEYVCVDRARRIFEWKMGIWRKDRKG